MAPSQRARSRIVKPRCTSTYRALRRSNAGISITRCFTTAYANDSGYRDNTSTSAVSNQKEGRYSAKSSANLSSTIGETPVIVPHRITRDLRRASAGTVAMNEFCARERMPKANKADRIDEKIRSVLCVPTSSANARGKLGCPARPTSTTGFADQAETAVERRRRTDRRADQAFPKISRGTLVRIP